MPIPPLVTAVLVSGQQIDHLVDNYGYVLVFALVALQGSGVPIPGTTALTAAAIYAGATHHLEIAGVIAAAAVGATAGYAIGYGLGTWAGQRLLVRYGRRIRLTPERLTMGRYVFHAHGGRVVFFGRFIIGLRTYAGVLAGANRMALRRFLVFDALGGATWALVNGLGSFFFGHALVTASTEVGIALAAVVIIYVVGSVIYMRRRGRSLRIAAQRAYPEAIDP